MKAVFVSLVFAFLQVQIAFAAEVVDSRDFTISIKTSPGHIYKIYERDMVYSSRKGDCEREMWLSIQRLQSEGCRVTNTPKCGIYTYGYNNNDVISQAEIRYRCDGTPGNLNAVSCDSLLLDLNIKDYVKNGGPVPKGLLY